MKDLTKFIIKKFLNKATCVHLLTFSAKFENHILANACQDQIKTIFRDLDKDPAEAPKEGESPKPEAIEKLRQTQSQIRTALNYLPPNIFTEILKRDDLELAHEYDLVHHVRHYLKAREEMAKNCDLTP